MQTISLSRWTDWQDIVTAATEAGGVASKHCFWTGLDPDNEDNALLIYDESAIDSEIFEQAFSSQNVLEAKKAADLKNIQGFRKNEYPPMANFLDAWVKQDQQALESYRQQCLDVKTKYPKT